MKSEMPKDRVVSPQYEVTEEMKRDAERRMQFGQAEGHSPLVGMSDTVTTALLLEKMSHLIEFNVELHKSRNLHPTVSHYSLVCALSQMVGAVSEMLLTTMHDKNSDIEYYDLIRGFLKQINYVITSQILSTIATKNEVVRRAGRPIEDISVEELNGLTQKLDEEKDGKQTH